VVVFICKRPSLVYIVLLQKHRIKQRVTSKLRPPSCPKEKECLDLCLMGIGALVPNSKGSFIAPKALAAMMAVDLGK
jgi:hypothetical protein